MYFFTFTDVNAAVDFPATTARPMTRTAHPPHASIRADASTGSTTTHASVNPASQAQTVKPTCHPATRNLAETVAHASTVTAAFIPAIAPPGGPAASANRLSTGAEIHHVKTEEDALKEVQAFTVTALTIGPAKCVTCVVFLATWRRVCTV